MNKTFETSDIVIAAALKVNGYKLDCIQKEGRRGVFCFLEVDDDILTDYDLGNLLVEPISFNNAIKALTTAVKRIL